ncbi:uncharacterized protein EV420DRAFT_1619478 [Desarmillaria tabescens]|uniref:Uncharacterized protein n=1 Tax=Armillaria tabescens TaxID=1929756 RepID=A0AA39N8F5_ARMTA|nr:uncharacterized protein EV420DRAFT_1619478 [Desarmillaria tabescens]KAK0460951.1 hypothetical protein EV420DRAFT_1619478 [Desarmillaria tabescens]
MAGRYRAALSAISARTGAPLSSLLVSFAVLHEITAIASFAGVLCAARAFGVGERVVDAVAVDDEPAGWARQQVKTWVQEGTVWAERVGQRYGIFGLEKKDRHLAGDVANAVFAYGVTKALFPVRIGLSLYLSPASSRMVVDPLPESALSFLCQVWGV